MKNVTFLFAFLFYAEMVFAQAGSLDSTFSGDGKQTISYDRTNEAHSVVTQADGKIVLAGLTTGGDLNKNLELARLNSDGSLDSSFGSEGIVATSGDSSSSCYNVALQKDGKIVAGGFNPFTHFGIVQRFTSDGSFDNSFGSGGQVTALMGYAGMAILPNGKILEGLKVDSGLETYLAFIRYNTDGSVDSSFKAYNRFTSNVGFIFVYGMAVQNDGKILIAGKCNGFFGTKEYMGILLRFNSDGTIDSSFGTDGEAFLDILNWDEIHSIALQADGKIVVGAEILTPTNAFGIARFTTAGTLDTTFSHDGVDTLGKSSNLALGPGDGLIIQPDGKILCTTGIGDSKKNFADFAVIRLLTNGLLDSSFGNNGLGVANFNQNAVNRAITLQQDGKIILAGNNTTDFAVARFLNDSCAALRPTFKKNKLANLEYQFKSTDKNIDKYFWTFGDGSSSTKKSPTHTYAQGGKYTVCLQEMSGCSNGTTCKPVNTNQAKLAEEDASNLSMSVYPNPSSQKITLRWSEPEQTASTATLEIGSANGQIVLKENMSSVSGDNEAELNIHSLPSGYYLVRLVSGSEIFMANLTRE